MSEKLSERMNRDGGHSTVYVPEVAALEQQLAAEQAAHDQIATICFRAGADGTSISAVLSLADIVIDLRQQLAAKNEELAEADENNNSLSRCLAERGNVIAAKDAEIARLKSNLSEILCSHIYVYEISDETVDLCSCGMKYNPRASTAMGQWVKHITTLTALAETPAAPEPKRKCICNEPENRGKYIQCPAHGLQRPREMCPLCKTHVIGTCPQGGYCTSDECRYVS